MIAERADLEDGDVLVVAQKAISKIEGRIVRLDEVEPSARARELAGDGDPRGSRSSSVRRSASSARAARS